MFGLTKRAKLIIPVCLILCLGGYCVWAMWHYHYKSRSANSNQIQMHASENGSAEETIKIDYDELDPEAKVLIADKISALFADATNEGMIIFNTSHKINDELEKKLIWSNAEVSRLLDSLDKDKNSIVSICVIKPREQESKNIPAISDSFELQVRQNLTMQYKCLEGSVSLPIALIKTIQTINDKISSESMILYYSKDNEWKKLDQ